MILSGLVIFTSMYRQSLHSWETRPLLTTIDSTSIPVTDIPFPAVTVCPEPRSVPNPWAYIQKLFGVTADNEKGMWSIKADRAFDEALDIDPKHWGARFAKAVSLSFWPAPFGRGPEAMKHFEVLVEQQEASGGSNPGHAQTYLFLGNMYEQRGQAEKAREIWQRGYNLHPNSQELGGKVKN